MTTEKLSEIKIFAPKFQRICENIFFKVVISAGKKLKSNNKVQTGEIFFPTPRKQCKKNIKIVCLFELLNYLNLI